MLKWLSLLLLLLPAMSVRSLDQLHPVLAPLLLNVEQYIENACVRDLDSVEFMSGQAEITRAHGNLGAKAVGFDKSYNAWDGCDINTPNGFQRAMQFALRIKRHGSIWAAPVCSSWIWISRSGSGRNSKTPGGDTRLNRVRSGNIMVVRLVLIFLVCWVRGVHLFLENPMSTIIHQFSPLKELLECLMPFKETVHMGPYGTEVSKPLLIWSSCKAITSLWRKPVKVGKTLAIRNENGGVTGKKDELKESQAYPPDFGKAVAKLFILIKNRASLDDLLDTDLCSGLEIMTAGTTKTRVQAKAKGKAKARTVKKTNTKSKTRVQADRTVKKTKGRDVEECVLEFLASLM